MMQRLLTLLLALWVLAGCGANEAGKEAEGGKNTQLAALLDNYFEENLKLYPLSATLVGDNRYNDQLPADFTDSHRAKVKALLQSTLDQLHKIDRNSLGENDRISYDFLDTYGSMQLEELNYPFNLIPTDQMWGQHLVLGQFASGGSAQPFKTVQDYNNWLKRIDAMGVWMDSAIVYFRRGMAQGITLPKPLVQKLIPQFEAMATADPKQHLFYGPINTLPEGFSQAEKSQLTAAYTSAITGKVVPMNRRMADFLKNEYLPKARTTSGYGAMPQGAEYYKLRVKMATTTNKTPEEIYQTGLQEVARIRSEMEALKNSVGFKGDLKAFFANLNTDPKLKPFKTPEEVLNAFRQIQEKIKPKLKEQFSTEPKTPFEIRQTEAFRAESASAEYNASPDNVKPGIFYVPILDARQFTVHSGMESLFLHEAIPGHHYQISLQRENKSLPRLRQYDPFSNAYVEGWALYCESLGKDLGLYTDPYQLMGALGDEMHRAIRLVVDVGLHTKGMTREAAIQYMMDNEPISEQGATAEIERYMSGPGQALGYKIGQLKIRELRSKYEKQLGSKFRIADFHTEVLKDGSMPLSTLEAKMDRWAAGVK
ncbi:Uncharacterized conserved protein, DUF885 familyt [Cnuella takakiae]|uniref:Uncharacterized conserved protein, DUF885 familyt n=1 Tax=Cnuella takakiae TaxID=1302690 RepID=A0A1M5EHF3_9BACT|nr:DUF885 domain-containing protein [Cnuella takakiae]SHF78491.1 Uncharacterized conserved protein, DUF885 familyt [Cnuella takakiae]